MSRNPDRCPTHPGELLREDVIPATGKAKAEIARMLGISRQHLHDILAERKPVSAEVAVRHLIEVACGLDSMVIGEPQIFGQIKMAYATARHSGSVGPELSRAMSHVFTIAKQVRSETAIGQNPVSVAFAAVKLARHIFTDLASTTALLIGAGETIELVARHLTEAGVTRLVVSPDGKKLYVAGQGDRKSVV